jgi:hypothetical protein
MKAGVAMGIDRDGTIISARLMGGVDQCLDIQMPWDGIAEPRWCVLPYPHEGDHDFSGGIQVINPGTTNV